MEKIFEDNILKAKLDLVKGYLELRRYRTMTVENAISILIEDTFQLAMKSHIIEEKGSDKLIVLKKSFQKLRKK